MAEESLNLSLDDIIKKNAENNKKKAPSGAGRGTGRGRGGRGGRGDRGINMQQRNLGVQKPVFKTIRGRGPASRGASRPGRSTIREPPRDLDELEGNKTWGHSGFNAVGGGTHRPAQQRLGISADPCRLEISNLDFNVTDNDIKELFSVAGNLKKHGVVFERSGRSEGKAFVVYEHRQDAEKALAQYHNIALDGKPMQIKFASGTRLSSGIQVGGGPSAAAADSRGRVQVQMPRTFTQAASGANIGRSRMRSNGTGRMDMD